MGDPLSALIMYFLLGVTNLSLSQAQPADKGRSDLTRSSYSRMLVTLKDEHTSTPSPSRALKPMSTEQIASLQDRFILSMKGMSLEQKVLHRYHFAPVISVSLSPEQIKRLSSSPLVESVTLDRSNQTSLESSIPFIGADQLHPFADGSGRAIAIIDTPVDPSHSDFGDCTELGSASCRVKGIHNFADEPIENVSPRHGSNVAAISLGMAPLWIFIHSMYFIMSLEASLLLIAISSKLWIG